MRSAGENSPVAGAEVAADRNLPSVVASAPDKASPARVREVQPADLAAVDVLARAEGWGGWTAATWDRLWRDNPAIHAGPRPARGWVLDEPNAGVVGFLSNLVHMYRIDGRSVRAATAASFIVRPEYRGKSLQLLMAFARQQHVELLLNTTASPVASKLFEFLRFRRIPQADYDRSFFWVLRPAAFAAAALRKTGVPRVASSSLGVLAGPILAASNRLQGRVLRETRRDLTVRVIGVADIDSAFDELWARKTADEPGRLLADRRSDTLRWHLSGRDSSFTKVLCAWRAGRLIGYLAIVRQDAPAIGLTRARVADVFVAGDEDEVISALLARAARVARSDGAAMLEVIGLPAGIRQGLRTFRPYELVNPAWPFLYKTIDPGFETLLQASDAWYASLYDGDGSL